ncbi:MAG: hypothetical protein DRJ45_07925 [Thermoprotei archaeon]|nr:MAG: hypothetical protein DRJ45_07925 [Thermoprotei archaeon]
MIFKIISGDYICKKQIKDGSDLLFLLINFSIPLSHLNYSPIYSALSALPQSFAEMEESIR